MAVTQSRLKRFILGSEMLLEILFLPQLSGPHKLTIAVESALRSSLSHVRFESKEFYRQVNAVRKRFQSDDVTWKVNHGPTPMRIVELLGILNNPDSSYDSNHVNFAFWPSRSGTSVQALEGFFESVDGKVLFFEEEEAYRVGNRLIRCGAATDAGNRAYPAARIYKLGDGKWRVIADKKYQKDFGTAKFVKTDGKIDPSEIATRVRVQPRHMMEGMSGPWLNYTQRWHVGLRAFQSGPMHLLPTPFAELDRLTGLVQSNKRSSFNSAVPNRYRESLWSILQAGTRLQRADNSDEATCSTFSCGSEERWSFITVKLARRQGHWRVSFVEERRGVVPRP
jgi:hypothetical protein